MEEGAGFTNAVMEGGGGVVEGKGAYFVIQHRKWGGGGGCKIADMSCTRQTEAREDNTVI